jgi:hypothetical protein
MRLFIILLLAIAIGVVVWQNLQPVTLIFFGGSMIARLPLAIWIALFTGAGLIASLIIQLLSNLFRPSRGRVDAFKPSPSPTPRPKKSFSTQRREDSFRPASGFTSPSTDWNNPPPPFKDDIDDWDIETPPTEATPIRDIRQEKMRERELIQNTNPFSVIDPDSTIRDKKPIQDSETEPSPKPVPDAPQDKRLAEESIDYEVPQSPQTVSRSGSIYSYTYRESAKSKPEPTEQVYDAEFRVIKPPRREEDDRVHDSKQDDERALH